MGWIPGWPVAEWTVFQSLFHFCPCITFRQEKFCVKNVKSCWYSITSLGALIICWIFRFYLPTVGHFDQGHPSWILVTSHIPGLRDFLEYPLRHPPPVAAYFHSLNCLSLLLSSLFPIPDPPLLSSIPSLFNPGSSFPLPPVIILFPF